MTSRHLSMQQEEEVSVIAWTHFLTDTAEGNEDADF